MQQELLHCLYDYCLFVPWNRVEINNILNELLQTENHYKEENYMNIKV